MADRESIVRQTEYSVSREAGFVQTKTLPNFFPVRLDFVRRKKYFAHPRMNTVKIYN